MTPLEQYRLYETRLKSLRESEDRLLDNMDEVWLELTDEEREKLRSEGPNCWPE